MEPSFEPCELPEHESGKCELAPELKLKRWERFTCDYCQENYFDLEDMKDHQRNHRFKCEVCPKWSNQKMEIEKHMKIRHKPAEPIPEVDAVVDKTVLEKFKCDFCTKWSNQKSVLEKHMKRHKPAEQIPEVDSAVDKTVPNRFKCDVCPRWYNRRSIMEEHMKRQHKRTGQTLKVDAVAPEQPLAWMYQCEKCKKRYISWTKLE